VKRMQLITAGGCGTVRRGKLVSLAGPSEAATLVDLDATPELAPPPTPPRPYELTTKQGTTTFQTGAEWPRARRTRRTSPRWRRSIPSPPPRSPRNSTALNPTNAS
jgi:hypothetical protein